MALNKNIRVIAFIFTIIWMIVIFAFSAQDAETSTATSTSVSYRMVAATDRVFGLELSEEKIMQVAMTIENAVRKAAHMIEYGILALFIAIAMDIANKGMIYKSLSFLICILYAMSDEIHQLFVPGRFGSVRDVVIDSVGALIAILIYLRLFTLCSSRFRKNRK